MWCFLTFHENHHQQNALWNIYMKEAKTVFCSRHSIVRKPGYRGRLSWAAPGIYWPEVPPCRPHLHWVGWDLYLFTVPRKAIRCGLSLWGFSSHNKWPWRKARLLFSGKHLLAPCGSGACLTYLPPFPVVKIHGLSWVLNRTFHSVPLWVFKPHWTTQW